ncbi:MAG: hypothetical protein H6861_06285 [Rhodospirillales bacterium]|nr:hypothetical protein [Rhodospirillales bacterium]
MATEKTTPKPICDGFKHYAGISVHIQLTQNGKVIETINARDLAEELKITQTEGTTDPNIALKRTAYNKCAAIYGI